MLLKDIEYWFKVCFLLFAGFILKVVILIPTIKAVNRWLMGKRKRRQSTIRQRSKKTCVPKEKMPKGTGLNKKAVDKELGVAPLSVAGALDNASLTEEMLESTVADCQASTTLYENHGQEINGTGFATPSEQVEFDIAAVDHMVESQSLTQDARSDNGDNSEAEEGGPCDVSDKDENVLEFEGPESNDPKDLGRKIPLTRAQMGIPDEGKRDTYNPNHFRKVRAIPQMSDSRMAPCGCYKFPKPFTSLGAETLDFLKHLLCSGQFWYGDDGMTFHNGSTHVDLRTFNANPLAQVANLAEARKVGGKQRKGAVTHEQPPPPTRITTLRQQESLSPESSSDETEQRAAAKKDAMKQFPDGNACQFLMVPFASDLTKGLAIPLDVLISKKVDAAGNPATIALAYLMSIPGLPLAKMRQSYIMGKSYWGEEAGKYTIFRK